MSRQRHSGICLLVIALFFCLPIGTAHAAATGPYAGQVRPGFMTGDSDVGTDIYLDLLIPLSGDDHNLFFFNPNIRYDDNDGNEQNIGFGYRSLLQGNDLILGGNLYYDTMRSEAGHRYKQWGVGAEILSPWADLRANYYNVFGDTKNTLRGSGTGGSYYFSGYSLFSAGGTKIEEALDGFDVEISVLIPGLSDFMETRLAATYFQFDADTADDPDGWRGRLDIRPVKAVNLSVEYRDDDLRGSDSFVGGYLEIPFSLENLFSSKNPFVGAGDLLTFGTGTRPFNERMTDKVVRDRHIVTVSTEAEGGAGQAVVDNQMIFVNQDNPNAGDGSFENPYQTLDQAASSSRFQPGAWIYVFSSDANADTYANTHFTLLDDQVFWGQGYQHPVYGLGGGINPILDGMGSGNVISLANRNEVMGFTIQNGETGIRGDNIQGANIHDNIIKLNTYYAGGIYIYNAWTPADVNDKTIAFNFTNNQVLDNASPGIYLANKITGTGTSPLSNLQFENTFSGNIVQGNLYDGIYVGNSFVTNGSGASIDSIAINNLFSGNVVGGDEAGNANGGDGIWVESKILTTGENSPISNVSITHTYADNQSIGNRRSGIRDDYLSIDTQGLNSNISNVALGSYLYRNTLKENNIPASGSGSGYTQQEIEVQTAYASASSISKAVLTIEVVDNVFSNNGRYGFHSEQYAVSSSSLATTSDSGFSLLFTGNTVENNGGDGVYSDSDGRGGDNTWMKFRFVDNRISSNGRDGLYLYIDSTNGELIDKSLFLQGNTITGNPIYGVELYVNGQDTNDFAGDFGSGTLGSTGGNTFANNGTWDIEHGGNANMNIPALNNTWTNNADPESTICDNADSFCNGDIITSTPE